MREREKRAHAGCFISPALTNGGERSFGYGDDPEEVVTTQKGPASRCAKGST